MLGVRGKLFLTSLALMLVLGAVILVALEHGMGGWLRDRLQADLAVRVSMARAVLESDVRPSTIAAMDPLADSLGRAARARVTIVASDGQVLGDSTLEPGLVERIDSHRDRPEIQAALRAGTGSSHRHSRTTHGGMVYVAERFERRVVDGRERGVVRVALSTEAEDRVLDRMRFLLFVTGLVGLGVSLLMSGLASLWASRALLALVRNAGVVAKGEASRLSVASDDELGVLAGSFNRLAERLERTVGELAAERDRFEAILGNMGEAVIALDRDDRVQLANRAALDLLGVTGEMRGQAIVDLLRAPAFAELLPRVRAEGRASTELSVGVGSAMRQVLSRGVLLADTSAVVVVMVDVTEIRRLEAVRRDFVANVSHELRTPVSIMRSNAEILLDGALADPEKGPMFAHAIARSAERLGRIVSDLLDLSRIESGALQLKHKPIVLHEVIERMLESHRTQARKRDITLEQRVPEELDVVADEDALEAVLANLIDNAIKYGSPGGKVLVRARADGSEVCLEVCDDGPGIEQRHWQRVFERFYRVDPGRSREMGGTGLGLSIVKHLCESMHGSVEVDDNLPVGSIFRVRLPGAKPASAT